MANDFIKAKDMGHVQRLTNANEAAMVRMALTELAYKRGCSRFNVSILSDTEFLGHVSYGSAHIYGIDIETKTEYFVHLRFNARDNNRGSINYPETDDMTWKKDESIEKDYPFLFSAVSPVKPKAMARRSACIQCWNRVR